MILGTAVSLYQPNKVATKYRINIYSNEGDKLKDCEWHKATIVINKANKHTH